MGLSEIGVRVNSISLDVINDYLPMASAIYCKNKFILTESLSLRILTKTDDTFEAMVLFRRPLV